ncbi:nitric oxide reductase transcriptional regulator NorR [Achromobacter xylosoxidans]|uniref:nitric oxide reductase transcriptional regulator NorR n=1 Tax=Alcaligenes xylosoxydans xylosoxydans TaxID=85698 RepID=UPI0003D599E2|nr:nitric oxide reductase transcriptional regulator NorR [Achromobacter xylosoxidans]AHC45802.1 Functional role page for Anaerobic nitric oxide reductase transcription regulator NorR [Achromobacter xylosoxidans NBRC 15126 = ATCC 27061]QKQ56063.1 nitric oxide reductase transcriptional regulator NorR [Achromobacter xylosoxidans]QPR94782.1 nitric oxide reductase transcriptional regulator NorR [Achromobacter xylosoxidans]UON38722.1 nitric oxide reductase transcriptional regulator NorR [Achromobacte
MQNLLLTDLVVDLPAAVRLQRLAAGLRAHFRCGAVALLQLEADHLRPVAVDGLTQDALGRRFAVQQHPRLAAILARRGVTCFHHDSTLPDPYDGLINGMAGEPLPVHDCMGTSLHIEGQPWGVLTLDALEVGTFDAEAQSDLRDMIVLVEAALRVTRLEAETRALRVARGALPADSALADDSEILGQSEAIARLLHEIEVVADSELPILLLGETGVGKELFAHRVHRQSRRRGKPLVHVNCAALPESLAESELFGHAKGAFSGALTERPGRFEAANGGTLFLDEVGELPLAVQAKLLRTLQNGEIQRLGDDRPRTVDVRIVAATNRDLRDRVRQGDFRADLYHRLSVYPVPIPPLRERGRDVLLLAGRYLELNRARLGLRSLRLSPEAEDMLSRYRWPGNVRELEHVISRAAIKAVSHGAHRNEIVTLGPGLLDLDDVAMPAPPPEAPALPAGAAQTLRAAVDACQRQAIRRALDAHQGSWAGAARALDIDSSNLHKLARRLGLKD